MRAYEACSACYHNSHGNLPVLSCVIMISQFRPADNRLQLSCWECLVLSVDIEKGRSMETARQSLITTDGVNVESNQPYISIVIPVYNEEENLETLQKNLDETLGQMNLDYEIIYVDDGSRDQSFSILNRLAAADK